MSNLLKRHPVARYSYITNLPIDYSAHGHPESKQQQQRQKKAQQKYE